MKADDGRKYRLVRRDDTRIDVLGGDVSRGNVYINVYAKVDEGEPSVDSLVVDGMTDVTVSLSGETGKYTIIRVA